MLFFIAHEGLILLPAFAGQAFHVFQDMDDAVADIPCIILYLFLYAPQSYAAETVQVMDGQEDQGLGHFHARFRAGPLFLAAELQALDKRPDEIHF